MPYRNMSVQGIAIDCLNSTKYMAISDAFDSLESTTPQIRDLMMRMNQEHLRMADEWNQLVHRKGWLQVSVARPELQSQVSSQVSSLSSQMGITYAQTAAPSYQVTPQPTGFPTVIPPQVSQ
ncbi:MAG: spore coat protein [Syntrophomonadaceae bacterium]|nr:spore coat protein [Syntrophomonadaceae bacterium]